MTPQVINEEYTKTGCRDCGHIMSHPHPMSKTGRSYFTLQHSDIHCTIYYDFPMKHFLHYLHSVHGSQEKLFYSCKQTKEELVAQKEIGKVLRWAWSIAEEQ